MKQEHDQQGQSKPRFEIRETRHHTFDVYDKLDGILPRWVASFKFFGDAKMFTEAAITSGHSESEV